MDFGAPGNLSAMVDQIPAKRVAQQCLDDPCQRCRGGSAVAPQCRDHEFKAGEVGQVLRQLRLVGLVDLGVLEPCLALTQQCLGLFQLDFACLLFLVEHPDLHGPLRLVHGWLAAHLLSLLADPGDAVAQASRSVLGLLEVAFVSDSAAVGDSEGLVTHERHQTIGDFHAQAGQCRCQGVVPSARVYRGLPPSLRAPCARPPVRVGGKRPGPLTKLIAGGLEAQHHFLYVIRAVQAESEQWAQTPFGGPGASPSGLSTGCADLLLLECGPLLLGDTPPTLGGRHPDPDLEPLPTFVVGSQGCVRERGAQV